MFWGNFPKMLAKKNSRVFVLSLIEGKTLGKLKVEQWNCWIFFLHLFLVRKKHDPILSFSLGCGTWNSWNTFFPQCMWNLRASSPCHSHISLVHRFVNFLIFRTDWHMNHMLFFVCQRPGVSHRTFNNVQFKILGLYPFVCSLTYITDLFYLWNPYPFIYQTPKKVPFYGWSLPV